MVVVRGLGAPARRDSARPPPGSARRSAEPRSRAVRGCAQDTRCPGKVRGSGPAGASCCGLEREAAAGAGRDREGVVQRRAGRMKPAENVHLLLPSPPAPAARAALAPGYAFRVGLNRGLEFGQGWDVPPTPCTESRF